MARRNNNRPVRRGPRAIGRMLVVAVLAGWGAAVPAGGDAALAMAPDPVAGRASTAQIILRSVEVFGEIERRDDAAAAPGGASALAVFRASCRAAAAARAGVPVAMRVEGAEAANGEIVFVSAIGTGGHRIGVRPVDLGAAFPVGARVRASIPTEALRAHEVPAALVVTDAEGAIGVYLPEAGQLCSKPSRSCGRGGGACG